MKETRLQEIKRCLARAEELGGVSLEPYDLYVSDVRYLVDMLEVAADGYIGDYETFTRKITRDEVYADLEHSLKNKSSTQL